MRLATVHPERVKKVVPKLFSLTRVTMNTQRSQPPVKSPFKSHAQTFVIFSIGQRRFSVMIAAEYVYADGP